MTLAMLSAWYTRDSRHAALHERRQRHHAADAARGLRRRDRSVRPRSPIGWSSWPLLALTRARPSSHAEPVRARSCRPSAAMPSGCASSATTSPSTRRSSTRVSGFIAAIAGCLLGDAAAIRLAGPARRHVQHLHGDLGRDRRPRSRCSARSSAPSSSRARRAISAIRFLNTWLLILGGILHPRRALPSEGSGRPDRDGPGAAAPGSPAGSATAAGSDRSAGECRRQ